ncbi:hypothetical protein ABZ461_35580 [Actinacidiphila glaucinigra]|uniref:hypothetical protein n=1 Tax=Actinacidiphila glaucinigra TaxID=235986 RepID=UPI0033F6C03F
MLVADLFLPTDIHVAHILVVPVALVTAFAGPLGLEKPPGPCGCAEFRLRVGFRVKVNKSTT